MRLVIPFVTTSLPPCRCYARDKVYLAANLQETTDVRDVYGVLDTVINLVEREACNAYKINVIAHGAVISQSRA